MTLRTALRRFLARRPRAVRAAARALFDEDYYRSSYPDVAAGDIDPFAHYMRHGWAEGRRPFALFDTEAYLSRYKDVEASGANPLLHYLRDGWREGRDPSDGFDTRYYLTAHPDVAASGLNPLLHYLKQGRAEGREPRPRQRLTRAEKTGLPAPRPQRSSAPAASPQGRGATEALRRLSAQVETVGPAELPAPLRDAMARAEADPRELVSVVMPAWNRRDTIDRALRSVFAQRYTNVEVILADDGSDDGTYEHVVEAYAEEIRRRRLKVIRGARGGVSSARNAALLAARGDIIAYLDSDNAWRDYVLSLYVAVLRMAPETDCVYTAIEVNDAAADGAPHVVGRPYDRAALLRSNFIDLNGFAHREAALREQGGFNVHLRRLVDWEFVLRVTEGNEPCYVPIISTDYYLGDGLANITKVEPIEPNFDKIVRLHKQEYLAAGIVSRDHAARLWLEEDLQDAEIASLYRSRGVLSDRPVTPTVTVVLDDLPGQRRQADRVAAEYGVVDRVLFHDGTRLLDLESRSEPLSLDDVRSSIVYWPSSAEAMLGPNALFAMVAAIVFGQLDVAVATHRGHGDAEGGEDMVYAAYGRDAVVVAGAAAGSWLRGQRLVREAKGRLLRLETAREAHRTRGRPLGEILGDPCEVDQDGQGFVCAPGERRGVRRIVFDPNRLRAPTLRRPAVVVCGMKVAVGGVERLSIALARWFSRDGSAVYLALEPTLDAQGSLSDEIDDAAAWLVEAHEIVPRAKYLDLLRYVERAVRPSAMFVMNGSMWLAQHAAAVREVFADTGIVDHQAYDAEVGWIQRYDEPGIRSFDRFVAINTPIRAAFRSLGVPDDRVDEIHHGIDVTNARRARTELSIDAARARFGLPPERVVAAFAGRLTDQKRPLRFLELARRCGRDADFLFLGDGVLRDDCLGFIEKHDLDQVRYRPFIPDVSAAFRAADVLIVTSAYEGLPLVVIEAMCVGLPVLATDVGEIREAVERFGAGRIVPANADDEAFEEALRAVIADLPALRRQAAERAESACEHYSMDTVATLFERAGRAAAARAASQGRGAA